MTNRSIINKPPRERESKPNQYLSLLLKSIIAGLLTAGIVYAWTNPTANPPSGGGALYYYNGNVGIGTTGPRDALDFATVEGASDTKSILLGVNNGPSVTGGGLVWKANYSGYTKRSAGIISTGEGNYFRSGLAFYTNGTADQTTDWSERMRIDMSGNVGIATTTPGSPLTVAGVIYSSTGGFKFPDGTTQTSAASSATAATQTEQEAGSSITVTTTPGRQQYHPSAAKAWVMFNGIGTPAVTAGYNVASITDNGVGDYTINFTTAMSSVNFVVVGTASHTNGGTTTAIVTVFSQSVGSVRIKVSEISIGATTQVPFDPASVYVVVFGDQ